MPCSIRDQSMIKYDIVLLTVYARVDAIWDNNNNICVSELELIEPELWFRFFPKAAESFAGAFMKVEYQQ
jgi:hypothetical protein